MFKTMTLDALDAQILDQLGYLQAQNRAIQAGSQRDDRSMEAGTPKDTKDTKQAGSMSAKQGLRMASMVPGLGMLGYAADIAEGKPSKAAGRLGVSVLGGINPVLGVLGGIFKAPDIVSSMLDYNTTLAQAFAAENPGTAKALGINQPDAALNAERLANAQAIGAALGIGDDSDQGRFDRAMAGFAAMEAGNTSGYDASAEAKSMKDSTDSEKDTSNGDSTNGSDAGSNS